MRVIRIKNKTYSTLYECVPQWGRIPLFIFFTLLVFYALKYAFLAYVGLLEPGGNYFLPILQNFSLIQGILNLLIYPSKFILALLGFDTVTTYNSIKIVGSGGVRIAFPCLGMEIIFSLMALIIAYPGKNKKRYLICGVLGIHCINIVRVTGLTLLKYYDPGIKFPGHDVFNLICYSFIILIFYWWVKNHSSDLLKSEHKQPASTLYLRKEQ